MNIIEISKLIQYKIKEIDKVRSVIAQRGQEKANAIGEYEKKLAITIIMIKNGGPLTLGDETILDPPVTIIEKIAKGYCYQEKIKMEMAETAYKSAVTNLDAICAQLNALQSLNRYLDRG